ncbi:gelsolin-like protein 1 [Hydractinia symbiolongicarpus]|uniref:gelsolin-like protein 1 n=1 Tax=Hydractinia symbiolongicarpus TaxID=13093 RepID=UPI00254BFF84|nr:gelsolin-like protein 1 [Hydractinia symbiolongicarpus]XP_057306223.1 gelsolin-like protein 1 [Hydractinia symbiolongicarpus]
MIKAKKYDWTDSNMALFGSDTDKKVKKESAETEPAWKGAGDKVGVQIWRIVKFKVTHWDKEQYGEFYNGDSYIILNTYKEPEGDELKYDVHFWIGKHSTQDEYGTAAYKTVELDTLLDDKPVQHREVQGHETKLFKSYFTSLTLLKGGAETGFRRVLPESYKTRLFHVKKAGRKITSTEISPKKGNLTSEDVFIIDSGTTIYQYNGSKCSHDEKFKAAQECARIRSQRGGKVRVETLEENSTSPEHPALMNLKDGESKAKPDVKGKREMFRVSDADGSLDLDPVDGYSKDLLTSDDVYVINTGDHCYCWVGKGASIDERKNGLSYASNYLNKTETPWLPITVIAEGKETSDFQAAF